MANGQAFTATVTQGDSTQRVSNNSNNIGYVQGVNKGTYTNNMNTMLNIFNNNVTTANGYLTWYYQNGTFSFKERLTASVDEPVKYTYNIKVSDPLNIGTYTYTWYKNGNLAPEIQGNSYTWQSSYLEDENMVVVISDGEYYAVAKFTIKKLKVDIVFDVNKTNASVTAHLTGEGLNYTSINDYKFQWYKCEITGESQEIQNETNLTLKNLEDGIEYKLVATNTKIPQLSTENKFLYGDRLVVYVNQNSGSNQNDGFTPETPVYDMETAYGKLNISNNRNKNVIVIMR